MKSGDLLVLELRLAVGDTLLQLEHLDLASLHLRRMSIIRMA